MYGSQNNDAYRMSNGRVCCQTNHAGGALGGITTGAPIVFRVALKPTPSIAQEQQSVSLPDGTDTPLSVKGRHDPCIVARAVPVVLDALLEDGRFEVPPSPDFCPQRCRQ